jgi:streptogramin lyase
MTFKVRFVGRFFSAFSVMTLVLAGAFAVTIPFATSASAATPPLVPSELPAPPNAGTDPQEVLGQGVCPPSGTCVVVGDYVTLSNDEDAVIETQGPSGSWSATTAPLPSQANLSPYAGLNGIACPAVGACVAVGFYLDSSGNQQPLVETLTSGTWVPTAVGIPSNSGSPITADLNSVSCAAVGACVAVGYYADTNGNAQALIETLSSGSWVHVEGSLPPTGNSADLYGVSCPAPGSCVAEGTYGNVASGNSLPLLEQLSSSTWTPIEPPLPSDAVTSPLDLEFLNLNGVSCSAVGVCVAVGDYLNQALNVVSFVETLSSGSWVSSDPPVPSAADASQIVAGLSGVSCSNTGFCQATGFYVLGTGADSIVHSFTEYRGTTWSPSLAALPANANSNTQSSLNTMTCTGTGACIGVGAYEDTNDNQDGLVETSLAPGPLTSFSDPSIDAPEGITTGPDGAVWFTNAQGGTGSGSIGRISTAGVVTNFTDPSINRPEGITEGTDGALWFTNEGSNTIGRISTAGVVSHFTNSSIDSPGGIVSGSDGALWFTNQGNNSIGRISTAGVVTNFTSPTIDSPEGITAGSDGALWFTNTGNNSIGQITTAGIVQNFTNPSIDAPDGIAAAPGGPLWFTNSNNSIGSITTAGVISNFTGTGVSSPEGIAAGPDGAMWFTNFGNNSIGRITGGGTVTNYTGSAIDGPQGIAAGPDGALWFTNNSGNTIGRVTPPVQLAAASLPSGSINVPYPTTPLIASGGTTPYTWSISSGALPAGLSLSSTGVISGTPASAESSSFTVQVNDDSYPGESATQAYSIVVNPGPSGPYSSLPPVRVCDTRPHNPSNLTGAAAQCNGIFDSGDTLAAGDTLVVNLAGSFKIPADATAVVLNVTAVNPGAAGYLTAYPTGSAPPFTSNVNYVAGQVVPNLVEVGLGTGGDVTFFSSAKSDLVVDAEGYVTPTTLSGAGLYVPLSSPARLCDTRPGNPSGLSGPDAQCNGFNNLGETLKAASSINVQVGGDNAIPANATAAVLNVTVSNPAAAGYLTAYPQGGTLPFASNVNYTAGQVTANRVIVPLSTIGSTPGMVTVYSSAQANVIVDVSGYYTAAGGTGAQFTSEGAPVRICDTRPNNPSKLVGAYNQCNGLTIAGGATLKFTVAGLAGVPQTGATAVVVNLTGVAPTAPTFLTVFPGPTKPFASDLNPAVGMVGANLVVATLSSTGTISIYNSAGNINVVVDVLGWYS